MKEAVFALLCTLVVIEVVMQIRWRTRLLSIFLCLLPRRVLVSPWALAVTIPAVFVVTFIAGIYGSGVLTSRPQTQWLSLLISTAIPVLLFRGQGEIIRTLRSQPIESAITSIVWPASLSELEYRDRIKEQLTNRLGASPHSERTLETGSRVDLWMSHDGTEYVISLKKLSQAANQQRLILQGELEDILAELTQNKVSRFHIIFVLGIPSERQTVVSKADIFAESAFRRMYRSTRQFPAILLSPLQTSSGS